MTRAVADGPTTRAFQSHAVKASCKTCSAVFSIFSGPFFISQRGGYKPAALFLCDGLHYNRFVRFVGDAIPFIRAGQGSRTRALFHQSIRWTTLGRKYTLQGILHKALSRKAAKRDCASYEAGGKTPQVHGNSGIARDIRATVVRAEVDALLIFDAGVFFGDESDIRPASCHANCAGHMAVVRYGILH